MMILWQIAREGIDGATVDLPDVRATSAHSALLIAMAAENDRLNLYPRSGAVDRVAEPFKRTGRWWITFPDGARSAFVVTSTRGGRIEIQFEAHEFAAVA
jgi:hypothetical protein